MLRKSKFYLTNHFILIIAEILFQEITNNLIMVFVLIETIFENKVLIIIKTTDFLKNSIILLQTSKIEVDTVVTLETIIAEIQTFVLLKFILRRETQSPPTKGLGGIKLTNENKLNYNIDSENSDIVSIFFCNLNFSDFIKTNTNISPNNCTFLLDTQADVSVIKFSSIYHNIPYDTSNYIDIRGVTEHLIRSLGSTELKVNGHKLAQKLFIVPDEFNIPSDGILGKDFLKRFQCTINYSNMTLTIHTDNNKLILKILDGPDDKTL